MNGRYDCGPIRGEKVIITPPSVEPITLTQAKLWLKRDDDTTDDSLITTLIGAAREYCEEVLGHVLLEQTLEYVLDYFPGENIIPIPFACPLQSVTWIKYKDSDGVETTWPTTEYVVDTDSQPGRVALAHSKSYPSFTPYPLNAVRIRCVAGVANTSPTVAFSSNLQLAMQLYITDAYANRGDGENAQAGPSYKTLARIHHILCCKPTRRFVF